MQSNPKPVKLARADKRSRTVGRNFLCPVVEVKPFNPWQSIYYQDYRKSLKKNASQAPQQTLKAQHATAQQQTQQLRVSQSQANLPVIGKPNAGSYDASVVPQRATQEHASALAKQPSNDEGKEFELRPNVSTNFPNNKCARDRKLNCILADNTEYFAHVMGKCICGLCTCGHCKCNHPKELNLGLKVKNEQSLYKHDYVPHRPQDKRRLTKQKTEQLLNKEPFTADTLYRVDYISMNPHAVVDPQNFARIERPGYDDSLGKLKAPFPANTMYAEAYLNWQNTVPVVRFNDKEEYNKVKVPFTGKPANQEYGNFRPQDITNQVDNTMFGKQQFKNPLGPSGEFKGESTTHNTYKKIGAYDRPRNFKENQNRENNINADGHFDTTYKDYNGDKPNVCPAREILSNARTQILHQSMRKYSELAKKVA